MHSWKMCYHSNQKEGMVNLQNSNEYTDVSVKHLCRNLFFLLCSLPCPLHRKGKAHGRVLWILLWNQPILTVGICQCGLIADVTRSKCQPAVSSHEHPVLRVSVVVFETLSSTPYNAHPMLLTQVHPTNLLQGIIGNVTHWGILLN